MLLIDVDYETFVKTYNLITLYLANIQSLHDRIGRATPISDTKQNQSIIHSRDKALLAQLW